MTAAGRVGVGEFVHQDQLRPAGQHGVKVHLVNRSAAVFDLSARDHLEPIQQGHRLLATVRFDDADRNVCPLAPSRLRGQQHLIRLADAGRSPQKDFQASASVPLRLGQQRVRRGPPVMPAHWFPFGPALMLEEDAGRRGR